jgi:hypothetical protein
MPRIKAKVPKVLYKYFLAIHFDPKELNNAIFYMSIVIAERQNMNAFFEMAESSAPQS